MVKKIINGNLYGKRKFYSMWGLFILLSTLLIASWLLPKVPNFLNVYENLMSILIISYFVTNAASKLTSKFTPPNKNK